MASEHQNLLGSAASVDAVAPGGASAHDTGKAKKHFVGKLRRRASSARRAGQKPDPGDRSRSPGRDTPDAQVEVAARSIVAPYYVEPGTDGDLLGVEGRHRNNMQKLFGYLAHLETVVNDHADIVDGLVAEQEGLVSSVRNLAADMKFTKNQLARTEGECKLLTDIVEANDLKLKMDFEKAIQGVWGFLEANNGGIMKLFEEARPSRS